MSSQTYCLPTRPFGLVAAINRYAAATGSPRGAMLAEGADYNGHAIGFVEPNPFKPYWTCYYTWAGIHTIGRGSLADCLRAARVEYDRGALGASARVTVETDEDAATCIAAGWVPYVKEADDAWRTDLHGEVAHAFIIDRQFGIGAVGLLANARSLAEYQAALDQAFAGRRGYVDGEVAR